MKRAPLVTALTSLTTGMAVAAPVVVFGFLYVLQVRPQRAAATEALSRLETARGDLARRRSLVKPQRAVAEASPLDEFDARTAAGDRVGDVADALTAALNSPAVGGVANVAMATGAAGHDPIDSMVGSFSRNVTHTPVTVTFDARYEQIGRFLSNLRVLSALVDLRSVELAPVAGSPAGVMRTTVSVFVFQRPRAALPPTSDRGAGQAQPRAAVARSVAPAAQPAPVVTSILFSSGRRVALVDGRVVGPGDRLGAGIVQSIEPDAVVVVDQAGQTRRFEMKRPVLR